MAIRKQYTEQVSVVITRAMRERIEAEAETRDVSMGTVIREIVQEHYAERDTRVEWTPTGPITWMEATGEYPRQMIKWSTTDPAPEVPAPGTLSVSRIPQPSHNLESGGLVIPQTSGLYVEDDGDDDPMAVWRSVEPERKAQPGDVLYAQQSPEPYESRFSD